MKSKSLFFKFLLIALVGGGLIGYFSLHQFSMPAEAALRLSEASLMADGAQPYLDFLDNVPPFYLYLNLLPVYISRLLSWHPILILNLLVTALVILSACIMALASETPARRNPVRGAIWPLLIGLFLVTTLQLVHFTEANQIFFLTLCPYIVCRAMTLRGAPAKREIATAAGAALCLSTLTDLYYGYYLIAFELCLLVGFFPFSKLTFTARRYLGVELKVLVYIIALAVVFWLLVPCDSTNQYLNIVTKINDYEFNIPLMALSFFDNCTDTRKLIYVAAALLVLALPQARQSILVRLFGTASLLGLALMILQGGTLAYQTYLYVGFAVMTLAASLPYQPLFRKVLAANGPGFMLLSQPNALNKRRSLPAFVAVLVTAALGTYFYNVSRIGPGDRYDLRQLGYHGIADKADLTILSEVVEQYSKVKDRVAILSLGARPAYPLITQLRRTPAFSLTWGFPIDILNVLEEPMYGDEVNPLRTFRKDMYARMSRELMDKRRPPVLVLIDEDETRRTLEERGVNIALQQDYNMLGMASLKLSDSKDGHPPLEYVGYRAALDIYRHK